MYKGNSPSGRSHNKGSFFSWQRWRPDPFKHPKSQGLGKGKEKKLPLLFLLGILFLLGSGLTFQQASQSDFFRINEILVTGNRILTKNQVTMALGINKGTNLLRVRTGQVEQTLLVHAWIKSVHIKRQWPDKLVIAVQEYLPIALIARQDKAGLLAYLDSNGTLFAEASEKNSIDFPVITGDFGTEQPLAKAALTLLRLTEDGNTIIPKQLISELHIDTETGLTLYLVDHPFPIRIGKENIKSNFYRLIRILKQLYRSGRDRKVARIDMTHANNRVLITLD